MIWHIFLSAMTRTINAALALSNRALGLPMRRRALRSILALIYVLPQPIKTLFCGSKPLCHLPRQCTLPLRTLLSQFHHCARPIADLFCGSKPIALPRYPIARSRLSLANPAALLGHRDPRSDPPCHALFVR